MVASTESLATDVSPGHPIDLFGRLETFAGLIQRQPFSNINKASSLKSSLCARQVESADLSLSPLKLFSGTAPPWKIDDFWVFGCPKFVPDKRLHSVSYLGGL
jgi:hypothetical protein